MMTCQHVLVSLAILSFAIRKLDAYRTPITRYSIRQSGGYNGLKSRATFSQLSFKGNGLLGVSPTEAAKKTASKNVIIRVVNGLWNLTFGAVFSFIFGIMRSIFRLKPKVQQKVQIAENTAAIASTISPSPSTFGQQDALKQSQLSPEEVAAARKVVEKRLKVLKDVIKQPAAQTSASVAMTTSAIPTASLEIGEIVDELSAVAASSDDSLSASEFGASSAAATTAVLPNASEEAAIKSAIAAASAALTASATTAAAITWTGAAAATAAKESLPLAEAGAEVEVGPVDKWAIYSRSSSSSSGSTGSFSSNDVTMERVKSAGISGVVSYTITELAFWVVSIPVIISSYHTSTGDWLSLVDPTERAKILGLSAGVLTAVRLAVPLRLSVAIALTPWVEENITKNIKGDDGKIDFNRLFSSSSSSASSKASKNK